MKEPHTKQNLKNSFFFENKQNYKVWKSTNSRKNSASCHYKPSTAWFFK